MNNVEEIIGKINRQDNRRRRITGTRIILTAFIIVLILIPTICCFILFKRVDQLQQQIGVLIQMHNKEYKEYSSKQDGSQAVYAAETDGGEDGADDTGKNNTASDKDGSVETGASIKEYKDELIQGKKVYLTFDDGPSSHTEEILDILSNYDEKATFFVTGKTDAHSLEMYRRIIAEGHTLGMHSYSHKYNELYESLESFKTDYNKLSDLLYDTTGVRPVYYRFPGGSSNTVSSVDMKDLIAYFNKEGIVYFDWNVINGDASGRKLSDQEMVMNVLDGVAAHTSSIVLMHDAGGNEATARILPEVLKELQAQYVTMLPITENTKPLQHVRSDEVSS